MGDLNSSSAESAGVQTNAYAYLTVDDPLIAWLTYRGEMVSAPSLSANALSFWHTRYLESVAVSGKPSPEYARELALEAVRSEKFPDKPSRLRGFYVFTCRECASLAARWGKPFEEKNLAELAVLEGAVVSEHDSEWITRSSTARDASWMERYWAGDPFSNDPVWECVVEGRALVLGTVLRLRAYEVVRKTWPESMVLLEMGRVAAELRSDLGSIAPVATINGNALNVDYMMNFADATNDDFCMRIGDYKGVINRHDFPPGAPWVVPDLRNSAFSVGITTAG